MKIVIDIPEARYKDIQRIAEVQLERNHFQTAEQIIANGTPLPKGHGDLVDKKQLDRQMYHMAFKKNTELQKWDYGCWIRYKLYEIIRDSIKPIIEADKAESEEV